MVNKKRNAEKESVVLFEFLCVRQLFSGSVNKNIKICIVCPPTPPHPQAKPSPYYVFNPTHPNRKGARLLRKIRPRHPNLT